MEGKYLYATLETCDFIKVIGKGTMKNSKTLSDLLDEILIGLPKQVIVDFSECTYLDSTFLGLMAKYAVELKMKWKESLYIFNPSDIVLSSMKQTGIQKFVKIITESLNDKKNMVELTQQNFDTTYDKSLYILEMHKILMNLTEENKKVFQNVVELMEKSTHIGRKEK